MKTVHSVLQVVARAPERLFCGQSHYAVPVTISAEGSPPPAEIVNQLVLFVAGPTPSLLPIWPQTDCGSHTHTPQQALFTPPLKYTHAHFHSPFTHMQ